MASKKKRGARAPKATKRKRAPAPKRKRAAKRKRSAAPFLRTGDFAKLRFAQQGDAAGERMWVEVLGQTAGRYTGRLDNVPTLVRGLRRGAVITFSREHVLARMRAGIGPSAAQRRQLAANGGSNVRLVRR